MFDLKHDTLLTAEEAAKVLGVTVRTVRQYIRSGKLAAAKFAGNVRTSLAAIEAMQQPMNGQSPARARHHSAKVSEKEANARLKRHGINL